MSGKISRRDFIKLSGVGTAVAAALTGCGPMSRYVVRRPYADMPEYNQTGTSTYYATTCRECPAGCGLIVRTIEGRAIKVEGNPEHPVNAGKLCSRGLTAVQGLYNPDRLQGPQHHAPRGRAATPVDWNAAIAVVQDALSNTPADKMAFLLGLGSDHLFDLVTEITTALGAPAPVRASAYEMFEARATLIQATRRVFGQERLPYFDMGQADVVFSFGANFLETWLSPVAYSRAYGQMRKGKFGRRGYLVSFEPRQSLTSGNADRWVPIVPGSEGWVALALGRLVAEQNGFEVPPLFAAADLDAIAQASGVSVEQLTQLAELFSQAESPLAIAGGSALGHSNGLEAGQGILALNALMQQNGRPAAVYLTDIQSADSGNPAEVQDLVNRMNNGDVQALFIHGNNPVFELPSSLGFSPALAKVPLVISFSSFPDETALQSDYVLPDHTPLESWGYQRTLAGSDRLAFSSSQPVVVPLYDTRSTADVLLAAIQAAGSSLAEKVGYNDEVDFVQKKLVPLLQRKGSDGLFTAPEILTFWSQWLQRGGWWLKNRSLSVASAGSLSQALAIQPPETAEANTFYLVTYATQLGDGSGANRPWLQETPHPMTTVIWNSWVEIHPDAAARLGIQDDDVVRISSPAGEIEAVAYLYPGIRPDTIALPFGQGHTALGRYAEGRGANPVQLIPASFNPSGDLAYGDARVTLTPAGRRQQLARLESREGVYGDGQH